VGWRASLLELRAAIEERRARFYNGPHAQAKGLDTQNPIGLCRRWLFAPRTAASVLGAHAPSYKDATPSGFAILRNPSGPGRLRLPVTTTRSPRVVAPSPVRSRGSRPDPYDRAPSGLGGCDRAGDHNPIPTRAHAQPRQGRHIYSPGCKPRDRSRHRNRWNPGSVATPQWVETDTDRDTASGGIPNRSRHRRRWNPGTVATPSGAQSGTDGDAPSGAGNRTIASTATGRNTGRGMLFPTNRRGALPRWPRP
jgi:hypothetical protein